MERGAGERQAQGVQERGDASMNLGIGKRSLLGLAAGCLMTLGVAAPSMAATTGNVSVSGANQGNLVLTITTNPASVGFGNVDPLGTADGTNNTVLSTDDGLGSGSCYRAGNTISFNVQSNRTYNGTVTAASSNSSPLNQLFWADGTGATCASTVFVDSSATPNWIINAGATGGQSYTDSYALHVSWTNEISPSYTLTYSVS
jgi:hypothetical protein